MKSLAILKLILEVGELTLELKELAERVSRGEEVSDEEIKKARSDSQSSVDKLNSL